jgi:predicted NAD/FAD-dependent oxidoreductase
MFDVGIIGAGLAGLTCARWLQEAGHQVVVLEKSRGVGGRMATRRLQGTCADHGLRYLTEIGKQSQALVQRMISEQILQVWSNQVYELRDGAVVASRAQTCYTAPNGMTAVAKQLAAGLEIWRGQRVVAIAPSITANQSTWTLTLEASSGESRDPVEVCSLAILIPAPQIVPLLQPLAGRQISEAFLGQLEQVTFDPCVTAIATYAPEQWAEFTRAEPAISWKGFHCPNHPTLAWVSLEHSKRNQAPCPVLVVQSNAEFARSHLDTEDLTPIGQQLLQDAAQMTFPWLQAPDVLQVHRWRYAFPHNAIQESHWVSTDHAALACGGDWCQGNTLESALQSGLSTAEWLHHLHQ